MTLQSGSRLGSYEIVEPLGAGGMGEVYRARDTSLNRHVAIKVLPEAFSGDAERLARFEREAQLLAALNHPHIAQIYGLERARAEQSPAFLAMELVEGEDLAQRIARGAVPLDEALPIAKQIAEALEAAHEQGIVHRDLKPANIKVRSDGTVKVLDFGLAKAVEASASTSVMAGAVLTQSPTLTSPMTAVGTLLGTAAYMAPEQARGRAVDRRADIWAFGCVLYEMLMGTRPFKGDDISDVLVSILRDEPDWTRLPADTPPYVRSLLRRCLQKDLQKRLPHIGVARLEFAEGTAAAPVGEPSQRIGRRSKVVGALGVLVAATVAAIAFVPRPDAGKTSAPPLLRFQIQPPPGESFPGANLVPRFAISPDGSRIVFGSTLAGVRDQLWIRRLDSVEPEPLRGTESEAQGGNAAQQPFWSPDGRFIGFFDEQTRKLKKLDTRGGPVQIVCDLPGSQYSGSWNWDDTILFSTTDTKGIQRVSARGGQAVQVTTLDAEHREAFHLWPQFLPDGRHFLYLAASLGAEASAIYVGSIDSRDRKRLVESDAMARFAPPNLLLYVRGESLMVQELDLRRLTLVGQPTIVADSVARTLQGRLGVWVADSGILVYAPGNGLADSFQIIRIDRDGREIPSNPPLPTAADQAVEVSPDGKRLAFTSSGPTSDIWIYDFERGQRSRLTTDAASDSAPIWSPDGSRIIFRSNRGEGNVEGLYEKPVSGATPETLIFKGEAGRFVVPQTWAPDGKSIVFSMTNQGNSGTDLWVLPLEGDRKPFPYLASPYRKNLAAFSPNGRWLAFNSNESGISEVYVQPFPVAADGRWHVSNNGGRFPRWRRDGRGLDYLDGKGRINSVQVVTDTRFELGKSEVISNAPLTVTTPAGPVVGRAFALMADGQQFVLAAPQTSTNTGALTVMTNWTAGLKR